MSKPPGRRSMAAAAGHPGKSDPLQDRLLVPASELPQTNYDHLNDFQRQELQVQQQMIVNDQNEDALHKQLAKDRFDDILKVHRRMTNLQLLYEDMRNTVEHQQETVDRIDDNIHVVNDDVANGVAELQQTYENERSRTKCNFWLLVFGAILLCVVSMILAIVSHRMHWLF